VDGVAAIFAARIASPGVAAACSTPQAAASEGRGCGSDGSAAAVGGRAAGSQRNGSVGNGSGGGTNTGLPEGLSTTSVRGSYSTIRSSGALGLTGSVVRTQYTPLSSDEGEEEDEMDTQLMRKYGLAG
jgi:hypothetical protein